MVVELMKSLCGELRMLIKRKAAFEILKPDTSVFPLFENINSVVENKKMSKNKTTENLTIRPRVTNKNNKVVADDKQMKTNL